MAHKKYPVVIDIKPKYLGQLNLSASVNTVKGLYIPHPDIGGADLYAAMEGFTEIYPDIIYRLYKPEPPKDNPIVYNIAVDIEGKYFLYTHDERIVHVGYVNVIRVDNLYTAMEGLSRRYKDVGEFAFRITTDYPF